MGSAPVLNLQRMIERPPSLNGSRSVYSLMCINLVRNLQRAVEQPPNLTSHSFPPGLTKWFEPDLVECIRALRLHRKFKWRQDLMDRDHPPDLLDYFV